MMDLDYYGQFMLLFPLSFIGHFVHPVGRDRMWQRGEGGRIWNYTYVKLIKNAIFSVISKNKQTIFNMHNYTKSNYNIRQICIV